MTPSDIVVHLHCIKESGLWYTRDIMSFAQLCDTQEVSLSQRMLISEIQCPSNRPHVIPQLGPITLNESA